MVLVLTPVGLALTPDGLAQTLARPVLSGQAAPTPTTGTTQAAATTVAAEETAGYVIGPDDSLEVSVWQQPNISGTFPVRPDGKISLVLVGDIQAARLTLMHLAHDITLRLKKYIQEPIGVSGGCSGTQPAGVPSGRIKTTGPIVLTPGMTPLQAIAAAGGLTPFTNGKHIYILRGPQGKQTKIPFNYRSALKGDNSQDVPRPPGDTIVVP